MEWAKNMFSCRQKAQHKNATKGAEKSAESLSVQRSQKNKFSRMPFQTYDHSISNAVRIWTAPEPYAH